MGSLRDLMQDFVNKDYNELLAFAQICKKEVLPACAQIDNENGEKFLSYILVAAVGADGSLSVGENNFFKDLMGYTDEQVDKLTDLYCDKLVDLVKSFFRLHKGDDISRSLYLLLLCVASCDGTISSDEIDYLEELFSIM